VGTKWVEPLQVVRAVLMVILLVSRPTVVRSVAAGSFERSRSDASATPNIILHTLNPGVDVSQAVRVGSTTEQEIASTLHAAVEVLLSAGVPRTNLCRLAQPRQPAHDDLSEEFSRILPLCSGPPSMASPELSSTTDNSTGWLRSRRSRHLAKDGSKNTDIKSTTEGENQWMYLSNGIFSLLCVVTAALAAGLTMGLLSLDPLMLLIKIRAGATKEEQDQAAALLPIVKQHHLLLVTLLLLNSMANEALPLFLEELVSPVVAVVMSVTLVLFFGEIVPSAIFTGPNKVALAYRMVPLVQFVMILLWPLAFPIAKLLDHVLHDENSETPDAFGRGELSALVRIQYEERMAQKQRVKASKAASSARGTGTTAEFGDNVGALDFASTQSIKASKKTIDRLNSTTTSTPSPFSTTASSSLGGSVRSLAAPVLPPVAEMEDPRRTYQAVRSVSIHLDEDDAELGATIRHGCQ